MKRRNFLLAGGAAAAPLMLGGCVTTQGAANGPNPLGNLLQETLKNAASAALGAPSGSAPSQRASGRLLRLGQSPTAHQAYAVYAPLLEKMRQARDIRMVDLPMEGTGTVPASTPRQYVQQQLLPLLQSLPPVLNDLQMAEAGRALLPLLNALGAGRRRGLRRVRATAVNNPVAAARLEPVREIVQAHQITLQPGQTARFVMQGMCADKTLPAFVTNDPLALRPARDFLSGDRFAQAQMRLLEAAARNPQLIGSGDLQFVIWALQAKEANGSPYYLQALLKRADLLRILESASPGIVAELQAEVMREELMARLQQIVRQNLPPEARRFIGDASIVNILADPARAPEFIEQELQRMANAALKPSPGGMQPIQARPEDPYTMVAPGVYAHAMGLGRLGASVSMTNLSAQPYTFVPHQWAAETRASRQRGLFTSATGIRIWTHVKAGVEQAREAWEPVETALALKAVFSDYPHLIAQKALGVEWMRDGHPLFGTLAKFTKPLHDLQLEDLVRNPALKEVARYTPIIGNLMSAVDVFDESLSAHERVLAAFGTVPGIGTMAKWAQGAGRFAAAARWANGTIGGRALGRASSITEPLRIAEDVYEIAQNLPTFEATVRALQAPLEAIQGAFSA